MAQQTVTGVISSNNRQPIEGVTVIVKGSNRATKTDASGRFSIQAEPGQELVFSHVSFDTRTYRVKANETINIQMSTSNTQLQEVVVTAMDIRRNAKELGYSVQTEKGADIKETQRENFINALQGRIAGLTVNATSGVAGAGSQGVLRGF